ncbi:11635_t:CDS:1, partial [Funneliformis geosporum]
KEAETDPYYFVEQFFKEGIVEQEIDTFEELCEELKPHFPGRNASTGRDAMIYKSFNTYTELFIEAVHLFADQYERLRGFGGGSFEQLFSSVRLGLYSAVENCVLSRAGLNYPDLTNDPSPRLNAVKEYLKKVYTLRVRFQVFDVFIRLDWLPKDIPGGLSQAQ